MKIIIPIIPETIDLITVLNDGIRPCEDLESPDYLVFEKGEKSKRMSPDEWNAVLANEPDVKFTHITLVK